MRDGSYPFDWLHSPMESVVAQIDEGFESFLSADNLVFDVVVQRGVTDKLYGFNFQHDFNQLSAIATQLPSVQGKYTRRVARFRTAMQEGVLFVRHIKNVEEFEYLNENMEVVLGVLRRACRRNDLLLLASLPMPASSCGGLPVYTIHCDEQGWAHLETRRMNRAIFWRIGLVGYPVSTRIRNYLVGRRQSPRRLSSNLREILRPGVAAVLGEERLGRILARVRSLGSNGKSSS